MLRYIYIYINTILNGDAYYHDVAVALHYLKTEYEIFMHRSFVKNKENNKYFHRQLCLTGSGKKGEISKLDFHH